MAVTLSADLTEIDDCDVITNWTSNENTAVDADIKREGSGSVGIEKVSQQTSYAQYDYYTDHSNTYLSIVGETHIYFWVQTVGIFDTKANGGLRIRVTDSAGSYEEWWVGGKDNYYGGFQCYVIYTGTTPNASSGSLIHSEIRYITIYFKITSKTVVNENNCWVDILYYGTGLVVKGGTSGARGTFDEIVTADDTPAYGVLSKKFGAFILQGPIIFGDSSGATSTYFKDTSQVLLFADALVSSAHYDLKAVGNSTGINSFQLGNNSGGAGIQGCFIKGVNQDFSITANGTHVNEFNMYGSIFQVASTSELSQSTTTSGLFISSIFEECGEVTPYESTVQYCKFINPPGYAIKMSSVDHDTKDSEFITCASGIHITASGTYVISNLKFTGGTYDIVNDSGGDVIINATNGSDPTTSINLQGGSTTINNAVTLTLTNLISNSEVRIYSAGTTTELDGIENCSTTFPYTYNYAASTYIDIVVHNLDYEYYRVENYPLASTAASLPIAQRKDRWYDNP